MQDWIAAHASRRGAHHEHAGTPNEDHAHADLDTSPGVVTVADGHGAPQYTRADRGARLATQAAVEVLRRHHDDLEGLPRALVDRWRDLVAADVQEYPPARGEAGRRGPHELYGTTVLAAADLDDRLLLVQLGDGDTILVRCDGADADDVEVHRPILDVEYAFPGATDSLVQADAEGAVRMAEVSRGEFDPDLVLLATDGLDASRAGRSWHTDVARRCCGQLRGRGAEELAQVVDGWCRDAAATGGDDSSMALLVSPDLLGGRLMLRTIANVVWLVVAGWELLLAWWLAGLVVCLTIVGIPFGVQLFKIGLYAAWPFGRRTEVVDPSPLGAVGNVLWVVLVGWWLALAHLVGAVAVALTIIGLPAAWVNLKLVPIAFMPFGRRVVEVR